MISDFYPRPPRGGRPTSGVCSCLCRQISIHALREEGDRYVARLGLRLNKFLSTPSARRATQSPQLHPPRQLISIHALREEGDLRAGCMAAGPQRFLSTPSARRATKREEKMLREVKISIHALREEGDRGP